MALRRRHDGAVHEIDPLIPILNLVCMLIPLLIFGAVFVQYHTLEVSPPAITSNTVKEKDDEKLDLVVLITSDGFHFKMNPKRLLPWMQQTEGMETSRPDIPKRDDGYDYPGLMGRLQEIKQAYPKETRIILGAEDTVQYEVLIKAMDASRGKRQELFPYVRLTRGIG